MKTKVSKVYHIIILILMLVDIVLAVGFILNKSYGTAIILSGTLVYLITLKII